MAYLLVANTLGGLGTSGGTTDAINTTGANLLVAILSGYTSQPEPTDNKSNTGWVALTEQESAPGSGKTQIWYHESPSVGTGHTFSTSGAYCGIAILAFSGAKVSPAFGAENGATNSSASALQTGSLTPTEDNMLLVFGAGGFAHAIGCSSVDVGTLRDNADGVSGNWYGLCSAYEIQTTATARNPNFTLTGTSEVAAVIATFKAAAVGAAFVAPPPIIISDAVNRAATH